MADINTVAKQFTDFYYQVHTTAYANEDLVRQAQTFDGNRAGLQPLYRDSSMLTWEDKQIQGASAIISHLQNLPFQKVAHKVTTQDAQPSKPGVAADMIVLVTGQLIVDDGPMTMNYSQTFHLIAEGGSYYVLNDIFRLVYG